MISYYILVGLVSFGIGMVVSNWLKLKWAANKIKDAENEAKRKLRDAQRRSDTIIKEADLDVKDKLFRMKSDFDIETKETRNELNRKEKRLMN